MINSPNINLSVIVPTYNTGKYLNSCLDTLINQTYKNMEIIVIDDFSSEDIYTIIEPYLKKKIPVKYKKLSSHRGPGGARNAGVKMSQGKYIAFCDSDDWVDLQYYETAIKYMDQTSAELGMCTLIRDYGNSFQKEIYKCRYDTLIQLEGDIAIKILTKQLSLDITIIPSTVNKIYKKSFLDRINLKFEEDVLFEDLLFSFISILNSYKSICIPNVKYHHYKRSNSIVQSFSDKHINDFVEVFTLLKEYLVSNHIYELYKFNYYKFLEQFYNLIIRQIFQFIHDENVQKDYIAISLNAIIPLIDLKEYLEFNTAEKLRSHIQPHISDTTIY